MWPWLQAASLHQHFGYTCRLSLEIRESYFNFIYSNTAPISLTMLKTCCYQSVNSMCFHLKRPPNESHQRQLFQTYVNRVYSQKYCIPGCFGGAWIFESSSAGGGAQRLEMILLQLWSGSGSQTGFSTIQGNNRSQVSLTWAQIGFTARELSHRESGWLKRMDTCQNSNKLLPNNQLSRTLFVQKHLYVAGCCSGSRCSWFLVRVILGKQSSVHTK